MVAFSGKYDTNILSNMDENQQTSNSSEQPKDTSPMLVIGIIIVIIVIIGAFWMTNNQSNTSQNTEVTKSGEATTTVPTKATMETSPEDSMMAKAIEVEGGNFYFKPNEIKVKKGEKIVITLKSAGGMHNFVIDEFNVESETISGGSTTFEFVPDKAGTFEFYCSIGNHRQMGMKGKLIVE